MWNVKKSHIGGIRLSRNMNWLKYFRDSPYLFINRQKIEKDWNQHLSNGILKVILK